MKYLVVVDMQNDFIDGSLGSSYAKSIVPKVVSKIKEAKENKWYVLATKDVHKKDETDTVESQIIKVKHCIDGTVGSDLNQLVLKELNTLELKYRDVYEKRTFLLPTIDSYINKAANMFFKDDIRNWFVEEIEVVGLCTSICVVSNALYLRSMFPCSKIVVDAACCADSTVEAHDQALSVMHNCCIEIKNRGSEPWRK